MKTRSIIEPLESRIAPSVVVNPLGPKIATYTDVDGDKVTIKISTGSFDTGNFDIELSGIGDQVRSIDLRAAEFSGASLTVTVAKVAGGDGVVNIGAIDATGIDLGNVTLPGDLGQIDAGNATTSTTALAMLKVRSLGLFGTATQSAGSLVSNINGPLGALVVTGDIHEASVAATPANKADGRIGSVFIGGSLIGSTVTTNSGQIIASGGIGPVTIDGDVIGGAQNSGQIFAAFSALGNVTIGGSVVGGPGQSSGVILATTGIGLVKIGGDLIGGTGGSSAVIGSEGGPIVGVEIGGSVLGGAGTNSANIAADGQLDGVKIGGNVVGRSDSSARISADSILELTIGGSLVGGAGPSSGVIQTNGLLGIVKIGRDIKGSAGNNAGRIDAGGRLAELNVGGSIFGGAGTQTVVSDHAGQVFALTSIGVVTIGGDVVGGSGAASGSIHAGNGNDGAVQIESVTIDGSLVGGSTGGTGTIFSAGGIGSLTVAHSVIGGPAADTGEVGANGGAIGFLKIGGSLVGGSVGPLSGAIFARGNLNFATIGGDVIGNYGERSGLISTFGDLTSLTIGGSLVGGGGASSATINASGRIGSVSIARDMLGFSLAGANDTSQTSAAILAGGQIGSVFVGGSIVSGTDDINGGGLLDRNATIRAGADIGSLTVRGGIIGNAAPQGDSPVIISAATSATPSGTFNVAIGSIEVGGRVEWARILAGFDPTLAAVNGDAQIGTVTVGGDWIASSLVAGSENLGASGTAGGTGAEADNVNFGNSQDRPIAGSMMGVVGSISSITIAGQVFGTPATARPNDSFGFVAEQIGALKVGSRTFTLSSVTQQDGFPIVPRFDGLNQDIKLHESGAVIGSTLSAGAPPVRVDKSTVTYTDSDGDRVTLKLSKPLLTDANVNNVVHFDTGTVGDGAPELRQLQWLDLRPLATNGIGVTLTVVRGATGDGLAHVGAIVATGFDVGAVKIPGDLGYIVAGNATLTTAGVASLNVRTLGRFGLGTQAAASANFTPALRSDIEGPLGALTVAQDIAQAALDVNGKIGAVTIGGSLIGGDTTQSGYIFGRGLGAVKIAHHLQGALGDESGAISIQGKSSGAAIGGSILGSAGDRSGHFFVSFGGGAVKVGHNVRGGAGTAAGQIENATGAITLGGSLLGDFGQGSGQITTEGRIAPVKIGGNIVGVNQNSGRIFSLSIASVTVGGSLIGGFNPNSGNIATVLTGGSTHADIGSVKIAHEIYGGGQGGVGTNAGKINSDGKLGALTVGGSIFGGKGDYNTVGDLGQVSADAAIGAVKIGGNLVGGAGENSGAIYGFLGLGSLTIGGSVVGGGGAHSAEVRIDDAAGSVKIGRELFGGTGASSGLLLADDRAWGTATIGGSIFGGTESLTGRISAAGFGTLKIGGDVIGGAGLSSGSVQAIAKANSISIAGSLVGGTGAETGGIDATELGTVKIGRNLIGTSLAGTTAGLDRTGFIFSADRIGGVTLGRSIFAGFDTSTGGALTFNGSIRATDDLGALTVKGSLHGTATTNGANPVIISAHGSETPTATTDVAIKSVKIGGRVERALILGGYNPNVDIADTTLAFANNKAQIGGVTVGRDWVASSLVAGIVNLNGTFGDGNDAIGLLGGGPPPNVAKIASIAIKGAVAGTTAGGDHFGFSSQKIGSFKTLGYTAPLHAPILPHDVIELSRPTADVTIRET